MMKTLREYAICMIPAVLATLFTIVVATMVRQAEPLEVNAWHVLQGYFSQPIIFIGAGASAFMLAGKQTSKKAKVVYLFTGLLLPLLYGIVVLICAKTGNGVLLSVCKHIVNVPWIFLVPGVLIGIAIAPPREK